MPPILILPIILFLKAMNKTMIGKHDNKQAAKIVVILILASVEVFENLYNPYAIVTLFGAKSIGV